MENPVQVVLILSRFSHLCSTVYSWTTACQPLHWTGHA